MSSCHLNSLHDYKYFNKCNGPYRNCPTKCNLSKLLQVSEQVDERYLMYQDFLKAMKNHTPYLMTPSEGKKALETIFALYQSTKSQEPVTLPLTDFSTKDMIDK